MKHKYYEVIKSWASGETLQYRVVLDDGTKSKWVDFFYFDDNKSPNFNDENVEWQVKPLPKKVTFRVGLMKTKYPDTFFTITSNEDCAINYENRKDFVKWISEWIEYVIEE